MHEMRLECHLDDGIFMKCKIRNAFILFFISTSILILTLFSEYRCYKTILFYEYNFKNELAINQVFFMLGFQYKQNFDECPEKRTFTDKLEIQCYPKNAKNYIILYYKSKITNYMIKSILNNKSDAKTFRGYFPDDFYKQYFSEIFEWSLKDRKIYLTEFDNIKKICIKEIQEQRNPSITNPRWEDENGRAISKALVGDEVYLCADVTDIADGATATIRIVEKNDDGNDDFVTELSAAVQDGKIRRKWKVVYTEDNDDTDSQKEMEEKGYTLPEYAFTIESSGVKSEESGQLDVKDEIVLTIKNFDELKGKTLKLVWKDGNIKEIPIDSEKLKISDIFIGSVCMLIK